MQSKGELTTEDAETMAQKLNSLLRSPLIFPSFSRDATIKTEAGIFDAKGNFFRPDRVALFHDKSIVIDYKTGDPKPSHSHQVNQYGNLLSSMGYPNVYKYLVYLDTGNIVGV